MLPFVVPVHVIKKLYNFFMPIRGFGRHRKLGEGEKDQEGKKAQTKKQKKNKSKLTIKRGS